MLHVALGVTDLARSIAFYRDGLGFALVADAMAVGQAGARALGAAGDRCDAVLLERDGFRLELLRSASAVRAGSAGAGTLAHAALAVDDLATTLQSLRDLGVEIVPDSLAEHARGVRSCLVRDPDGFPILLHQAPAGVASPWAERRGASAG